MEKLTTEQSQAIHYLVNLVLLNINKEQFMKNGEKRTNSIVAHLSDKDFNALWELKHKLER